MGWSVTNRSQTDHKQITTIEERNKGTISICDKAKPVKKKAEKKQYHEEFNLLWKINPHNDRQKQLAEKEYANAIDSNTTHETILAAFEKEKKGFNGDFTYMRRLHNWLKQKGWEDERKKESHVFPGGEVYADY